MSLITAVSGGKTLFNEHGQPYNEGGEPCFMDTDYLELKEHFIDNDVEQTKVTEYWDGDHLCHRSVDMVLKQGLDLTGQIGEMG